MEEWTFSDVDGTTYFTFNSITPTPITMMVPHKPTLVAHSRQQGKLRQQRERLAAATAKHEATKRLLATNTIKPR